MVLSSFPFEEEEIVGSGKEREIGRLGVSWGKTVEIL